MDGVVISPMVPLGSGIRSVLDVSPSHGLALAKKRLFTEWGIYNAKVVGE